MRSISGVVVSTLALAACGGGGGSEPLIAGSLTGNYAGEPFTPSFGFATVYMDSPIIGLGDGDIGCGSPEDEEPPPGTNAIAAVPSLDVGSYTAVLVNLYHNVDGFEAVGSTNGEVTINAASADSVAGEIAYHYTDVEGLTYALSGTFEVVRCD